MVPRGWPVAVGLVMVDAKLQGCFAVGRTVVLERQQEHGRI